jgi:hypothetical protein
VVDHAETSRDLPGVLRRLFQFLDLPVSNMATTAFAASSRRRRGVHPRGGALGWIYPRVYTMLSRGPFQWLKRTVGVASAERLKRALRLRESAEALFFKTGYPKLAADGRRRLHALFQDDIAELQRLDLLDVRGWTSQ